MGEARKLEQMSPEDCLRIARIMGPASACAQALADYESRKAAGERVGIFKHANSILVGTLPPEEA